MNESACQTVAIVGAGPVGLAAAAKLIARGLTPILLERGTEVGTSIRNWAHVKLFTPWRSLIDETARELLDRQGWSDPQAESLPSGAEFLERYLEPLAAVPEMAASLRLGLEVTGISRDKTDKLKSAQRQERLFKLHLRDRRGVESILAADAVIDASGTWATPNPIGADGLPALGERAYRDRIWYGIPDPLGRQRDRYAGKRCLIVGSGYSAANVVLDLVALKKEVPSTTIVWAIRGDSLAQLVRDHGEGPPSRVALGKAVLAAQETNAIELVTTFRAEELQACNGGVDVIGSAAGGKTTIGSLDEIICTTGQRPDLDILRELRVDIDPSLECVPGLRELIDPNLHSCYSVPPHGWHELAHPLEPGFYIVGMKSYGRAPTFLTITGYQQVSSVVAAISGDFDGANMISVDPTAAMADEAKVHALVAEAE